MKVNFATSVEFRPDWNGNCSLPADQQLKMTLTPLEVGESLHLMTVLQAAGFDKGDATKLDPEQSKALVDACGQYIPTHVTNLSGNEDFSLQDIVKWLAFMNLAAIILFKLIEISQPNEADVKNSKPQHA